MITFQTLEKTPVDKILDVFNSSFSDYVVSFSLTMEKLEEKIRGESIRLEYSVGAFEENELIAFILHGYNLVENIKTAYNAGTGVVPSKRGKRLTTRMYEFILPVLNKNFIDKVVLEVITTNEAAIKVYEGIGFKLTRQLACFSGSIHFEGVNSPYEIHELENYNWKKLRTFWDIMPSWQNSVTAMEILKPMNVSLAIYDRDQIIGYCIYNPKLRRIHQLAVDRSYRRKGAAQQLLNYISTNYGKDISVINVDKTSKETFHFLTERGMKNSVDQHEMELILKY